MKQITIKDYVQGIATESNLLKECIYVLRSFSDYLYFIIIVSEMLDERIKYLKKYKRIDHDSNARFSNSFVAILNNLNAWVSQNVNSQIFLNFEGLSDTFVNKINVKNRNELIKLILKSENDLEVDQKMQFIEFVQYSMIAKLSQSILNLPELSLESKRGQLVDFASSAAFHHPMMLSFIFHLIQNELEDLSKLKYSIGFNVDDNEISNGYKKPVYIDIDAAIRNTYLSYSSNVCLAFANFDEKYIQEARKSIEDMLFFFSDESELNMPSDNVEHFGSSKINFKTILDYSRISNGIIHQNNFLIYSIPSDIEKRKFFVLFPRDYQLFSSISNILRAREYEVSHPAFSAKYEGERKESIRVLGLKDIITELDFIEREIVLKNGFDSFIDKYSKNENANEALLVGSLTYLLSKAFNVESPLETGIVTGSVEFLRNIIMNKK